MQLQKQEKERVNLMKKLFSIICILAMVLTLLTSAFAATTDKNETPEDGGIGPVLYWYINTNGVHLRNAPSMTGTSLGLLYYGNEFFNYGEVNSDWRHVKMTSGQNAGKTGYVYKIYTSHGIAI